MSKLEPNVVGQTGRPGLTSLIRIHVANPSDLEELRDALDHAQCPTIQNGDTLLVKDPLPADEHEHAEGNEKRRPHRGGFSRNCGYSYQVTTASIV